jgi:pimeloyl-ACP methyl ester carboxylesterase
MEPHVEIHGQGSLPPLLLVHGFLSSRAQWRPNLEGLTAFCRPVILELWGHGRSPTPDDPEAYSAKSYITIFEKIRGQLDVERWFLFGQSFGAGLTLRYALMHPDRIEGQIFTNSVSGLSHTREGTDDARSRHALALEKGGVDAIEALPYHPRHARRFAPELKTEMLQDASRVSPRGIANAIRYTVPTLSVAQDLGRTTVPTLLVNGTWDKAFQPLRQLATERLPSLQVVDLEGGHSINAEAPERFNEEVRRFLVSTMHRSDAEAKSAALTLCQRRGKLLDDEVGLRRRDD